MLRIGLIDVDGHNFPNLALMRISAWHKAQGDTVEWWWTDLIHYDIVYKSKVFSDAYTKDIPDPLNADKVIRGVQAMLFLSVLTARSITTKLLTVSLTPKRRRCSLIIQSTHNMTSQSV